MINRTEDVAIVPKIWKYYKWKHKSHDGNVLQELTPHKPRTSDLICQLGTRTHDLSFSFCGSVFKGLQLQCNC